MNTTELFVEHLITGLMSIAWIMLFSLGLIDFNLSTIPLFHGFEAIALIFVFSMAYPLGIFTDNLADSLLKRWNNSIRKKYELEKNGITVARVLMTIKNEDVSKYFNYVRMRIARSAGVNFLLLTISSILFLTIHKNSSDILISFKLILTVGIIGLILTLWALWSWKNIVSNYHKMSKRILEEYTRIQNDLT